MLLRAELTADWKLHLFSIARMINLFAATGRNNYAKCARLYVDINVKKLQFNQVLTATCI